MPLWWGRPKCPVDPESRDWIHFRMQWLIDSFGPETIHNARAIEPTDEFFPDPFAPNQACARRMLDRVCGFMGVEPDRVELAFYTEAHKSARARAIGIRSDGGGTAGLYFNREKQTIAVETSYLRNPESLVATIAHELAHVRLLGESRLTGKEEDHEPLTDLTTVFFGMGIFNANSTFRFKQWSRGGWHGWESSKLGYLDEQMFAYALALWSTLRGEAKPKWARHLRTNPRVYMNRAARYLAAHPPEKKN